MIIESSSFAPRVRVQTRQASTLNLSAAVFAGKARIGRFVQRPGYKRLYWTVDWHERRRVEGHFNAEVRPKALAYVKMGLVAKVGRKELALITDQRLADKIEFACRKRGENLLAERPPLVAVDRAAGGLYHGDLEVDIFRKSLDEAPSLR